jgi:hypothetical protein
MKNALLLILILLTATSYSQRSNYKNLFEQNGKIGIGTNKPDALLTVKGIIHTQEVLVDLKGAVAPDYVFELFIKENHHLPGVPSAETLEKEGLSLKEMNLILLEKIEELTLHVLEQKKEIEVLKEKYASLKE